MIKKVITEYCDACGRKIRDYASERDILLTNEEFPFYKICSSFLLCKDCTLSFNEWKKSRDPEGKVDEVMRAYGRYICD